PAGDQPQGEGQAVAADDQLQGRGTAAEVPAQDGGGDIDGEEVRQALLVVSAADLVKRRCASCTCTADVCPTRVGARACTCTSRPSRSLRSVEVPKFRAAWYVQTRARVELWNDRGSRSIANANGPHACAYGAARAVRVCVHFHSV